MLPAGSVVDLRDDGRVKESFTPADQQDLARQREARRQQIRHCREICARVTDYGENARCTDNCKPR